MRTHALLRLRLLHDEMPGGGVLPLDLLDSPTNGWIRAERPRR